MAARRAKAEADDSDSKPATSTQAAPDRPGRTSTEDSDPHEKATKAAERGEKAATEHPHENGKIRTTTFNNCRIL